MRALALAAAFACAFLPDPARADGRELYVTIGLEPARAHTDDAFDQSAAGDSTRGALGLSVYYGLTNTLHLGAVLRTTMARNIQVSSISVPIGDGTRPTGTLYEDLFAIFFGALAQYRVDTGYRTAPVVSVEAGFASFSYTNRAHAPAASGYSLSVASASYTAPYVRPAVGLEYRMSDRLVAGVAVAAELAPGAHQPWAIAVPFNVGMIW